MMAIRCGLEVHAQINYLQTKLFCYCSTDYQGKIPNLNTCEICKGLPGTLPHVNGSAIKKALLLAKALNMEIASKINFSRKHYDYQDLPKGFQLTQADALIGKIGFIPIESKDVFIRQIQLEEDPAKLAYKAGKTIVDYNRSGISLIELVTEPVFENKDDILEFLEIYRQLLIILKISNTWEEGAFRVDVNVSVGSHPRVEVKNIGSDSEILKAFNYEVKRQIELKLPSEFIETRHWDSKNGKTVLSREKESNADYKYMTEGDIPTIDISVEKNLSIILPELPWDIKKRLEKNFQLNRYQQQILLNDPILLSFHKQIFKYNEISIGILNQFFWRDYLEWYNSPKPKEKERAKNIIVSDVKLLLLDLQIERVSIQEYRKNLRNYFSKGKQLWTEIIINNEMTSSIEMVLKLLQRDFPGIWDSSFTNPNQINFLVGQGIKLSKRKINPKLLLNRLKNRAS